MYTLVRHAGLWRALVHEAPSALLSLALSEVFYKFHSFTLECLAFLATWNVGAYLVERLFPGDDRKRGQS